MSSSIGWIRKMFHIDAEERPYCWKPLLHWLRAPRWFLVATRKRVEVQACLRHLALWGFCFTQRALELPTPCLRPVASPVCGGRHEGKSHGDEEDIMYEAFYGLTDEPFSLTPNPKFFYLSTKHEGGLEHLLYGIARQRGLIVLTGDIGTGKTTLLNTNQWC